MKQLESEAECINWYMTAMEKGIDMKAVIEDYADLQEKHNDL